MVSSKDVAKKANVSQSTVSRVLNNPEKVLKKKREKVIDAIKKLNYRPDPIARSLVSQKTRLIALISGPLHNPFFVDTTTSIVNYAKSKNFDVQVHFEDFDNNFHIYQDVLNNKVDGIILSSILYEDKIFEELKQQQAPFIMFNRRHKNRGNYVEMDNQQAGEVATNYLLNLNHKDIVWVGGPLSMTTFWGRCEGFKYSLAKRNLIIEEKDIIITDTSFDSIFLEVMKLISRKTIPTAIVAATDSIAIYIIDILKREGYRVPEDISIVGIDNVELSNHSIFSLSTVGIETDKNLGLIAIEHLINLIEGRQNETDIIQQTFETKLFARETTKGI